MATLTFDTNDEDLIVHYMEEYEIPFDKFDKVKAHIVKTMTNPESYWYNEVRWFAEGMES